METTVTQIPFTAWEQAVFVVLFIVFVIGVLTWFTKQSDKWQNFIARMEEQWRIFNRDQRKENNECMQGLADVIQQLLMQVKEMREDDAVFHEQFHAHDAQAKEILHEVKTNRKTPPKPRTRKPNDTPPAN